MKKQKIRVGLSLLILGGIVPVAACFSSNGSSTSSSNAGAGGTVSSTDQSTTSSSGGGSSSTAPGAPSPLPSTTTFGPVIDDMTNPQTETGGAWYTYSDRSVPNSEPPIIPTPAPAGTVTPVEGAAFPPVTPGTGNSIPPLTYADAGMVSARECTAKGEITWGAGFGMDLTSVVPDGSPVALDMCDAGNIFVNDGGPQNVGIPEPYDATAYTGFSFWGIALGTGALTVEVHVDDDQTTPWGGQCNVCVSSGHCAATAEAGSTAGCPCSDNFIAKESFKPGQWKQYAVRWSDLANEDWSLEGKLTFHQNKMYNIHFQFTTSAGVALPAYDVAVAYLQWLTN
ncbi:MAG: hypothetical protein ABSC94_25650 [Polyangiaceae bacterium]